MKKFLLVCLLGAGLLLPSTTITAKETLKHRIINVGIEGWVLTANSQKEDGPITLLEIRKVPDGKLMHSQTCNDYTTFVNISGLPAGSYVVNVVATNKTFQQQFRK